MPYYSEELIEEVRSRNDILDVISGYVQLKKKGSAYFGLCPFHSEKTGSFCVTPSKQMFHCFGCGAGGNVFSFVMQYDNLTFTEAVEQLASRAGVALPSNLSKAELAQEKREREKKEVLLAIQKDAATYYYALLRSEKGKRAYAYFKERKLSDETMKKFGLGYADQYKDDLYKYLRGLGYSDQILKSTGLVGFSEKEGAHDRFWNRAMFPIMDKNGKVIAFGGRVMGEGEPKYLNSPETEIFEKGKQLYGLHIARLTKKPQFLLCEGYMDVISLHQAGFDNALAALGTALTPHHAQILKRYKKDVYLTFDSDGAGIKAALRAIPILKEAGVVTKVIDMKPYKDPDEFIKNLGAEEYQKRIDNAQNSFLFQIRILYEKYDMNDPESKTMFQKKVANMLLEFSDELERNNYMEAVCRQYQIGFEEMRRYLAMVGNQRGLIKESAPLKSGKNAAKKKENGIQYAQKLLLTWLIEKEALYPLVKPYIRPEDFTEGIYQKVAEVLFEQLENRQLNPAKIIDLTQDSEEQQEIASLFHSTLEDVDTKDEKEKALKDVVIRIRENSFECQKKKLDPTDIQGTVKLIEEKKKLEQLKKVCFELSV